MLFVVCFYFFIAMAYAAQQHISSYRPTNLRMNFPTIQDQTTDWIRYLPERTPYMSEMTVCAWEKSLNASADRYFASYATQGHPNEFVVGTGEGEVHVYVDDNDDFHFATNHSADEMNHFCVWFSLSDDTVGVYVNGLFVESQNYDGGPGAIRGGGAWVFGQDQDSLGGGFDAHESYSGEVINFVIFPRMLTAAEVWEIAHHCSYPMDIYICPNFQQLEWHGDSFIDYVSKCPRVPHR